jgi:hypothetical protein
MLSIDKKKAFTLFALASLIASLLLANYKIPVSAQTEVNLHGPSLAPIHLHSNITLTPIHMHSITGLLDYSQFEQPNCTTWWHELYPNWCDVWHLTSWEDDNGDQVLSPNDQIDMTNEETGEVQWFHVDRITITLLLSGPYGDYNHTPAQETMAIELKLEHYDPDILYFPIFYDTFWHEVWQSYSNVYQLTSWQEAPGMANDYLDWCDSIDLQNINTGEVTYWHVEHVATDLILRWKMMDPVGTFWHQLYPPDWYCTWWEITSWYSHMDPYCDRISPLDVIDMVQLGDDVVSWWVVDRITITINVTDEFETEWKMLELKTWWWEEMYYWIKHPLYSIWHEVYPDYSNVYNLTDWDFWYLWPDGGDNCNGVLDPCDWIELTLPNGTAGYYHITDMAYDLILNPKIADPVCTDWLELSPEPYNLYHVVDWVDSIQEGFLTPCDYVALSLFPTGFTQWYHVKTITLTINVTNPQFPGEWYLYELNNENITFEDLYGVKTEPICTWWNIIYPPFQEPPLHITDWIDNCNGVLDFCDMILLGGIWVHVEDVSLDMVVVQEDPPPPPPWYKKPPYPNYAPSGVPDFDQKQDQWSLSRSLDLVWSSGSSRLAVVL